MKHYITPQNIVRAFESDGSQDYLIAADMKLVELPDAPSGAWVIDYEAGEITVDQIKLDAILNPVPRVVTRFQARAALRQAGLRDQVEAIIADPETDPLVVDAWADAQDFRRSSPTIAHLADQLGLTDAEVDDLFRQAATIEA